MAETEIGNLGVKISLDHAALSRQLKIVQNEFKEAGHKLGDFGKTTEGLKLRSDSLTKQLDIQRQQVKALEAAVAKSTEVKGADAKATQLLEVNLSKAKAQMAATEAELKRVTAELEKQSSGWYKVSQTCETVGGKLKAVGASLTKAGKTLSAAVTAPLVGLGALAARSAIDFESAFAGVRKTVDATEEEFSTLEKGIRDMAKEIPAAATEIAGVAEAAGQLGIAKENILGFTRTMIDLGEATNLSSEQAASALARFANITQMSQENFDRLGSTIVALGNNLATTEADIVNMGQRLAGAGAQIGLTEAQIMSFAGALSSVGVEAEAGGSAFSKVMVDMQLAVETGSNRLNEFAKIAGTSAEEFRRAFQEDAASAIIAFIQGLGNAEKQGMSAIKILDDMGITEVRLRDSLLRAAGASEVFTNAIALGTQAWEENIALQNEAGQRYGTTESQLAMLKNQLVDLGIQIGQIIIPALMQLVEAIRPLVDWFSNLSPEMQKTAVAVAGLAAVVGPLLAVLAPIASTIGGLITGLGAMSGALAGGASLVSALSAGFPVLGAAIAAITGPVGLVIAAIAGLVAAGVLIYKNWDTIKEKAAELWQKIVTAWENLKASTTKIWGNIKQFLADWWPTLLGIITGPVGLVAGLIVKNWDEIKATTENIWNAISGFLAGLWERIRTTAANMWYSILETITSITDNIKNLFSGLVSSAWDWGKNLLGNFIDGIKSMFSRLWDALSGIGETISGYLGFSSPTKLGPGRFADEWAPNFMKMFAKGIEDNASLLQNSLEKAVESLAATVTIQAQVIPAGEVAARMALLSPGALRPAVANSYSNSVSNYGGNTFHIHVSGGSTREQAEDLLRELAKRGVRF